MNCGMGWMQDRNETNPAGLSLPPGADRNASLQYITGADYLSSLNADPGANPGADLSPEKVQLRV